LVIYELEIVWLGEMIDGVYEMKRQITTTVKLCLNSSRRWKKGIAEYKKVGWNPLLTSNMENRNPSREAIHRIRKDIKDGEFVE
jgi:hypothetical protein